MKAVEVQLAFLVLMRFLRFPLHGGCGGCEDARAPLRAYEARRAQGELAAEALAAALEGLDVRALVLFADDVRALRGEETSARGICAALVHAFCVRAARDRSPSARGRPRPPLGAVAARRAAVVAAAVAAELAAVCAAAGKGLDAPHAELGPEAAALVARLRDGAFPPIPVE